MTLVRVTFDYEPAEPDAEDPTGISAAERERLNDALTTLGADSIDVTPIGSAGVYR